LWELQPGGNSTIHQTTWYSELGLASPTVGAAIRARARARTREGGEGRPPAPEHVGERVGSWEEAAALSRPPALQRGVCSRPSTDPGARRQLARRRLLPHRATRRRTRHRTGPPSPRSLLAQRRSVAAGHYCCPVGAVAALLSRVVAAAQARGGGEQLEIAVVVQ
jgi:hypothetical protein